MKRWGWIAMAVMLAAGSAWGQQAAPAPAAAAQAKAPTDAQKRAERGTVVNPVSGAVKAQLPRFAKAMVAAAGGLQPGQVGVDLGEVAFGDGDEQAALLEREPLPRNKPEAHRLLHLG